MNVNVRVDLEPIRNNLIRDGEDPQQAGEAPGVLFDTEPFPEPQEHHLSTNFVDQDDHESEVTSEVAKKKKRKGKPRSQSK